MEIPFIKKWLDKIRSVPQLPDQTIMDLADQTGVTVGRSTRDDSLFISPLGILASEEDVSFFKYWRQTFSSYEDDRLRRYSAYDVMDANSTETGLALDTYADEATGVGFVDDPLRVEFTGVHEDNRGRIIDILKRARIYESVTADVRSLAKYGDFGYRIIRVKNPETEEIDIIVRPVSPYEFSAKSVKIFGAILGYEVNEIPEEGGNVRKQFRTQTPAKSKSDLKPWEFVHFLLPSNEFYPYGKSILEKVRSAYDQLATLEALLAVARASKIDRIVVRVPVKTDNPVAAFDKLQKIRAQYKSMIIGTSQGGRATWHKEPAITDQLWIPSGDEFGIDKLPSSVDIATTDDVEYFLGKFVNGLRLPKGYLTIDEVTDRGGMLSAQDLKFARALVPLQRGYVTGVAKLATYLAIMLGERAPDITAKLLAPTQISQSDIARYKDQIAAAVDYIKAFQDVTQQEEPPQTDQPVPPDGSDEPRPSTPQVKSFTPEQFAGVLERFGVPPLIARAAIEVLNPDLAQKTSLLTAADTMSTIKRVASRGYQEVSVRSREVISSDLVRLFEQYDSADDSRPKSRKVNRINGWK